MLRKDSIKTNHYSEEKKIAKGLNRPFSQNTNLDNPKIDRMFETDNTRKACKDNKENESIRPVKRRIIFNSFSNNYFPESTKNANNENLNLNDNEENEFTLESYNRMRKCNEIRRKKHQSRDNVHDKFVTEPCHKEELEENYFLSNINFSVNLF